MIYLYVMVRYAFDSHAIKKIRLLQIYFRALLYMIKNTQIFILLHKTDHRITESQNGLGWKGPQGS